MGDERENVAKVRVFAGRILRYPTVHIGQVDEIHVSEP